MNTSNIKNAQFRPFWNQEYIGPYGTVLITRGLFYKKYADFILAPSYSENPYFKNLKESSLNLLIEYMETLFHARRLAFRRFCFSSAQGFAKDLQHVAVLLKDDYGYSGLTSQQINVVKDVLRTSWFIKPLWVSQDIDYLSERIRLFQKK